MARSELRRRVDALDKGAAAFVGPAIWLVLNPGETSDQGIARWEALNGPSLPNQPAIIWHCIETGITRDPESFICGA